MFGQNASSPVGVTAVTVGVYFAVAALILIFDLNSSRISVPYKIFILGVNVPVNGLIV